MVVFLEVTPGFEPGNQGFADPCLTTWLCHRCFYFIICSLNRNVHCFFKFSFPLRMPTRSCVGILSGAGNEARTRYLHLGKVALYQMSYARKWCPEPESNQRHGDFQSPALPTELQRHRKCIYPCTPRIHLLNRGPRKNLRTQGFAGKRRNFSACHCNLACKIARQAADTPTKRPGSGSNRRPPA